MLPKPLAGATVVEVVSARSASVTAIAVAFAGRLAAGFGADVMRVTLEGDDFLATLPPLLPDGSSALQRFLCHSKRVARALPPAAGTLICDDAELAQAWQGTTVLIEAGADGQPHTELTVLAASGLLDIVGEPSSPPLPLPGHQASYAAGLAAFDAMVCAHLAERAGAPASHHRVSVIDVALWLNWKHYLAAYLKLPDAGIGRAEDWRTYRCRDGFIAFVFQDKDLEKIAALTGDARFTAARFATLRARRENIAEFCELVQAWASTQMRDSAVEKARALGLPIAPVLGMGELLADAQMLERSFIDLTRGSPGFGMPRLPVTWEEAAPA